MDLRVDAADLGELEIAVDRMDAGVRVTIGVPDENAARALEPERLRLLGVLTGSGVRVESVTVIRAGAAGTALAHAPERAASASSRASPPEAHDGKRPRKKNHFVG